MDSNYQVVSGNAILNIYTFFLLIANILLVCLLKTGIVNILIILPFFNLFNFIVLYGRFYSFCYDDNEIVVKHMWSKSIKKYLYDEISHVEFRKIPRIGKVFVVISKSGRKRGFGASVINREALEKMVSEINSILKEKDPALSDMLSESKSNRI